MKELIDDIDRIVGLTVTRAIRDGSHLAIHFDDKVIAFHVESDYDSNGRIYESRLSDLDIWERNWLGICTDDEYQAAKAADEAKGKETRRKAYEQLKKEFEG